MTAPHSRGHDLVTRRRAQHARRLAGERTADLAREEGVTAEALRDYWRRCGWGVPRGPASTQRTAPRLRALHVEYAEGRMRMADCARAAGITVSDLTKRWGRLGLAVRGHRGPPAKPDPVLRAVLCERLSKRPWKEIHAALPDADRARWATWGAMAFCALGYARRWDLPGPWRKRG